MPFFLEKKKKKNEKQELFQKSKFLFMIKNQFFIRWLSRKIRTGPRLPLVNGKKRKKKKKNHLNSHPTTNLMKYYFKLS